MFGKIVNALHNPEKIFMRLCKIGFFRRMDAEKYISICYRLAFGRKINLSFPTTYTEKLNWCKLHWYNPLVEKCVDKYDVRAYVAEKIGVRYLNQIYGVWDSFEDIEFSQLPNQFVLKVTNGSGDIYICKEKQAMNIKRAKKQLDLYKNCNLYYTSREWPYLNVKRRYIAERLIKSSDGKAIKDYKIFCFHGEPKFCFVGSDRDTSVKFDFFDLEWNYIPVRNGHDHKEPLPRRPLHWEEMLNIAKKLSEDFPHVRVDLYEEEGRIYFGELTFFHFGGFTKFEPDSFDYQFGKMFDLGKIDKKELR